MGEETSEAGTSTEDVALSGIEQEISRLAAHHHLEVTAHLWELTETLVGLSCRDQEERWVSPEEMALRRREGFDAAKRMKRAAERMLEELSELHKASGDLHTALGGMNPALLEAIFDINTGGPDCLSLPSEILILETLFRGESDDVEEALIAEEAQRVGAVLAAPPVPLKRCPAGFWEEVDDRLTAAANLPVRSALTRGPMPNIVLRSALRNLRAYWIAHSDQPWGFSSLRHKEVRAENDIETLVKCERFVAYALTITGIRFSLADLLNAWMSIDTDLMPPEAS